MGESVHIGEAVFVFLVKSFDVKRVSGLSQVRYQAECSLNVSCPTFLMVVSSN